MFGGTQADEAVPARTRGTFDTSGDLVGRILDSALTSIADHGIAKTTLGDLARAAGCSRATVYRLFPGGKDEVVLRLGTRELERFLAEVGGRIDDAEGFEDALVAALTTASVALGEHRALQFLLTREPEWVLPYVGFRQLDRLFAVCRVLVGPHFERFLPDRSAAGWAAEWCARLVVSHVLLAPRPDAVDLLVDPSAAPDLRRPDDASRLVRTFLLPALTPGREIPRTPSPTATALQGSPA